MTMHILTLPKDAFMSSSKISQRPFRASFCVQGPCSMWSHGRVKSKRLLCETSADSNVGVNT
jgi:hypothetical protein